MLTNYNIILKRHNFCRPGNDVSTEQSKHDTTDTEQKFGMYMRDFDFLEYELESLEGESVDNFNWGVRRPSLTNLEEGNFDKASSPKMGAKYLPLRYFISAAPILRI